MLKKGATDPSPTELGSTELDGAPLAVCLNDCELDCGQHPTELVSLCYKVRCAFAEMRWGTVLEQSCEMKSVVLKHLAPFTLSNKA
jgi:hypothetical protein